jgi:hypothetical protein
LASLTLDNTGFRCLTLRGSPPPAHHNSSYISALKFVHILPGLLLHAGDLLADPTLQAILWGAAHQRAISVTFPLLLTLGTRIAQSPQDPMSTGHFGLLHNSLFSSARLAKILASEERQHDPSSDLTWADIKSMGPSSILLHFKSPKSEEPEGQFVDLFSFPASTAVLYSRSKISGPNSTWSNRVP